MKSIINNEECWFFFSEKSSNACESAKSGFVNATRALPLNQLHLIPIHLKFYYKSRVKFIQPLSEKRKKRIAKFSIMLFLSFSSSLFCIKVILQEKYCCRMLDFLHYFLSLLKHFLQLHYLQKKKKKIQKAKNNKKVWSRVKFSFLLRWSFQF